MNLRKRLEQGINIVRVSPMDYIQIKSRNRSALNHGAQAAHHNVLDLVLVQRS